MTSFHLTDQRIMKYAQTSDHVGVHVDYDLTAFATYDDDDHDDDHGIEFSI